MSLRNRVSRLIPLVLLAVAAPVAGQAGATPAGGSRAANPDPESVRPIDLHDSVWIEDLTWMEVRDLLREGRRTVLIPTGGIEQNGPYLVLGKHNVILRATMEAVARKLGDALVAPVVPFVPEGQIDPPSGHMRYPGTVSVRAETFHSLLLDLCRSMRAHGFEQIILLGDSGGNQEGMAAVAAQLSREWQGTGTSAHFVPEYYEFDYAGWIASQGIVETDEGLHDDVRHSAIMMLVDPRSVRMEERIAADRFSINGVELAPADSTLALARRLVDAQADATVGAIRRRIARSR
jgi:creatinine amidohydrolase/Fe(II)-dependent formamide hydrolase-like protein